MANHRPWASWQTFYPVHPMEDRIPGGVRLPRADEPPNPIDLLWEKELEEAVDYCQTEPLYETFDDPVSSVPPPEERPRGWMPCPEVDDFERFFLGRATGMAMPTPRPPKGWRDKGRPDAWQRFYLDRGAARHAVSEAEANRELWIAFLLDRGAGKNTAWWRSFERRFARCAAADPYYAAGDTPCAME
uniref:Uncharacterized protein n=1 Tax=Oryza punctata TaxID=4537 RepID=A0A0E0M983_ORYPU